MDPMNDEKTAADLGLNDQEMDVIKALATAWNKYVRLPQLHPDDTGDMRRAVHAAQNVVMARAAVRAHPEVFTTGDLDREGVAMEVDWDDVASGKMPLSQYVKKYGNRIHDEIQVVLPPGADTDAITDAMAADVMESMDTSVKVGTSVSFAELELRALAAMAKPDVDQDKLERERRKARKFSRLYGTHGDGSREAHLPFQRGGVVSGRPHGFNLHDSPFFPGSVLTGRVSSKHPDDMVRPGASDVRVQIQPWMEHMMGTLGKMRGSDGHRPGHMQTLAEFMEQCMKRGDLPERGATDCPQRWWGMRT